MQNKTMPRNRQNSEARESVNAILVCNYIDIRKRKASGLQVFTVLYLMMKIVVVEDAGCMKCPSDFLFGHDFFPGKHTVRVLNTTALLPSY